MSDTPRDGRWNEPGLPSELAGLLRAGREPLGTPKEVAELARRLSAVLGPAAGLTEGGGQGPSDRAARPHEPSLSIGPSQELAGQSAGETSIVGAASRSIWGFAGAGASVAIAIGWFIVMSGRSVPVSAPDPPPSPPAIANGGPLAAPAEPASAEPEPEPRSTSSGQAEPAPRATAERPRASRASSRRAGSQKAGSPRARGDDAVETALLEQARSALQSRPAEALELTRRHQARFPRGALAQEREVIAIQALERLGQKETAAARAAEFERRYRGSVHRSRLLHEQKNP